VDEFAVGELVNGDFPEDDEQRWRVLDAPRIPDSKVVRRTPESADLAARVPGLGHAIPSFPAQFLRGVRRPAFGKEVCGQVSIHSVKFSKWLKGVLENQKHSHPQITWRFGCLDVGHERNMPPSSRRTQATGELLPGS
jgi:hypothetical protein